MSLRRRSRRKRLVARKYQWLHRAQEVGQGSLGTAQAGAARAAERVGPAAQHARDVATVRVSDARAWTAPRLERTAHYVEHELGPRVGSLIHSTAHKVKPARRRNRRRIVALILLMAGGLAGALGAFARRRNTVPADSADKSMPAGADAPARDDGEVRTR